MGSDGNLEGVVEMREERRSLSMEVTGEGKAGGGFSVCWDRNE